MRARHRHRESLAAALFAVVFAAWILAAWMTHVVACLSAGKWLLLIAGAILVPVAWVHGTGLWFGAFR